MNCCDLDIGPHEHGSYAWTGPPFTMDDVRRGARNRELMKQAMEIARVSDVEHLVPKLKRIMSEEKLAKYRPQVLQLMQEIERALAEG